MGDLRSASVALVLVAGCSGRALPIPTCDVDPAACSMTTGAPDLAAPIDAAVPADLGTPSPSPDLAPRCTLAFDAELPLAGAVDVPTSTPIQARVSCDGAPVDPARVALRLQIRGVSVDGTSDWVAGASMLEFHPARPLALATTYQATVLDVGNAAWSWSFTTREGSWTPEQKVAQLPEGNNLSVDVSPGGRGILALASFNEALGIEAVRFDTGSGFSSTVDTIKAVAPAALHHAHAAIDDADHAWVTWIEYGIVNNAGNYFFWSAQSSAGGSWTLRSDPGDTNSLDYIYGLGLHSDGSGMAVLSRGSLEAESPDGATSVIATNVLLDADAVIPPAGGAAVAWRDGNLNIGLRLQSTAGVWDAPLTASTTMGIYPRVATGPDGSVLVSWQEYEYMVPGYGIIRRWRPGQGLGAPFTVDSHDPQNRGNVDANDLQTGVDLVGDALALWLNTVTYMPPGSNIYTQATELRSQRFSGGGWDSTYVLVDGGGTGLGHDGLAVSAQGNAFAVWLRGGQVRAARFYPAKGWQPSVLLGGATAPPVVKADASGRAVAAWYDNGEVHAALFNEQ